MLLVYPEIWGLERNRLERGRQRTRDREYKDLLTAIALYEVIGVEVLLVGKF